MASAAILSGISVRQLQERDLPAADKVFRTAFGTFMGLPDPGQCFGDADYIYTRWRANPDAAFAAEAAGEVVGSNFATRWGSVAFFGPLTVRPDLWDKGIGKRLLEPVMERFTEWRPVHTGLFTFAQSPKHIHLYQKFGFWPRCLTAVMSKTVARNDRAPDEAIRYSALPDGEQADAVAACRELTDSIFAGLDVTAEIGSVAAQRLGETILVRDNSRLAGFAVCHCGPGTEAGSGECYIKFGAVRSGRGAAKRLARLVDACEALVSERGLQRLVAGMNLGRVEAFQTLAGLGFRTDFQGVAMEQPNRDGYNRQRMYIIDDWR